LRLRSQTTKAIRKIIKQRKKITIEKIEKISSSSKKEKEGKKKTLVSFITKNFNGFK